MNAKIRQITKELKEKFPESTIVFQDALTSELIRKIKEDEIVIHLFNVSDDREEAYLDTAINQIYDRLIYTEGADLPEISIYTWRESTCRNDEEFAQIIRAHQKAANASLHA